jgi:hypothetical protein
MTEKVAASIGFSGRQAGLPGPGGMALTAIGKASRERQARILKDDPTAEVVRDASGKQVGVVHKGLFGGRVYSGRPEFDPISGGQTQRDEQATIISAPETTPEPEVTPEVTPEIVPDDLMGSTERGRRRSKRLGGAGTLLEGGGALYE